MKRFICLGWNPRPIIERVVITDAPRFMHGIRIAFAADFHIRSHTKDAYLDMLCAMLADTRADMLALGGDYGESAHAACRLFERLNRLEFPLGCFAVAGNNDVECFGEARALCEYMRARVLVNEAATLRVNGGYLHIAGADELKYGNGSARGLLPRRLLNSYSVLISHYPKLFRYGSGGRPRLMLAGHTHAGQINLGGFTIYNLRFENRSVDHVSGFCEIDGTKLLVSPGIGVSRLPIRIGAPPKIHVIEFS